MNTKHTPGPWTTDLNLEDQTIEILESPADPADDAVVVASLAVALDDGAPDYESRAERTMADARLLAAAPELLEALRLATEVCALNTGNGARLGGLMHLYPETSPGNLDFETLVARLRAVIAKATGGAE